jgi:hypothetical protein
VILGFLPAVAGAQMLGAPLVSTSVGGVVSGTNVYGQNISGTVGTFGGIGSGLINATGISITTNQTSVTSLYASGNVGIGTASPTEKLDIGGGNIKMGYEVQTATGNLTIGVSCSAGKQVLGGGCNCTNGGGDYLRSSVPNGTTGWSCVCNSGSGNVAYAICANIK